MICAYPFVTEMQGLPLPSGEIHKLTIKKGFCLILSLLNFQRKGSGRWHLKPPAWASTSSSRPPEKAKAFVPPYLPPGPAIAMDGLHKPLEAAILVDLEKAVEAIGSWKADTHLASSIASDKREMSVG
jgi:hypothetical protein